MKKLLFIISIIISFGCSSKLTPTVQEALFLTIAHECFAKEGYALLRPQKAIEFLRNNKEQGKWHFLYVPKGNIIHIDRALVNNIHNIAVPIERWLLSKNNVCFQLGNDRKYIRPWMSECEWIRENCVDIQSIKLNSSGILK